MNFWETVLSGIVVFVLGSSTSWAATTTLRRRSRQKAEDRANSDAQWTFELLKGDEWTLRRDSPFDAFSLRVWEFGTAEKAGDVHLAEHIDRGDLRSGDSVRVSGIRPGTEVLMDWVENAERLAVEVTACEGARAMVIKRGDTHAYFAM